MSRVKQQLKSFYRGKGLKGKRLKRAVWADVGRVKCERKKQYSNSRTEGQLDTQFAWGDSKDGHIYWARRAGWRK